MPGQRTLPCEVCGSRLFVIHQDIDFPDQITISCNDCGADRNG